MKRTLSLSHTHTIYNAYWQFNTPPSCSQSQRRCNRQTWDDTHAWTKKQNKPYSSPSLILLMGVSLARQFPWQHTGDSPTGDAVAVTTFSVLHRYGSWVKRGKAHCGCLLSWVFRYCITPQTEQLMRHRKQDRLKGLRLGDEVSLNWKQVGRCGCQWKHELCYLSYIRNLYSGRGRQ